MTDSSEAQPETNDNNNVYAVPFNVTTVDLHVTSVTAPNNITAGQTANVSWTVQNSGTGTAGSDWTDAVYLSTKSTLDDSATLLTTVDVGNNSPLAAGASYTQSTQVTIPLGATTAVGSYYILVKTNLNESQVETSYSNDLAASSSTSLALPPLPELEVTNISTPTTGFNDQTVNITWTDVNDGTAAATGPWTDKIYLSTSSNGSEPTLVGAFTYTGSLAAGASLQRTQSILLPSTAGAYYVVVIANADGGVQEGPLNQNGTTISPTPIEVSQAALPDLVVTSITPPDSGVLSGTSVPISFTVLNQGAAPTSVPVWTDWVILSQDPTLGASYQGLPGGPGPGTDQILNNQPVIVGFQNPSYLGVGDSYTQTVNVTLPIYAQGTWYVYIVPDGTGYHHPFAMPEASRADKLALSTGFTVDLNPPADLAVTNVRTPGQAIAGQPITLDWEVANQGSGPPNVSDWTDSVYMSTSSTFDASATACRHLCRNE